ncbi:MAG TPA: hypothetical protein VKM72_23565 [Thermoanaerobaculia bacterium]|nr:hypothetical protein [Thermoanaerobaculia bacterium]
MDLFQMARDNAETYARRYESLRAALGVAAGRLELFAVTVRNEGRLAVNRRLKVLLRFLDRTGSYYNVHEWAAKLERRSGRPRGELLRLLLGAYYDRRMAFDRCVSQGERLHYGALHLGGLGAVHFGDYCLVFKEAFAVGRAELAYLWADSLKTYLLPGCMVDEEGLQRDACPHSHRHYLAALKHGADAASLAEERWPALICSRDGFIEALFAGSPTPGDLQAVRMDQVDYDLYTGFLVDAALGRLGEGDRHLVEDFDNLLDLLERHSIPLEKVAA